jgi:hypothetical protein
MDPESSLKFEVWWQLHSYIRDIHKVTLPLGPFSLPNSSLTSNTLICKVGNFYWIQEKKASTYYPQSEKNYIELGYKILEGQDQYI